MSTTETHDLKGFLAHELERGRASLPRSDDRGAR